jgi:molybdenum cofactor biosynthesis enzyme MoaA
VTLLTRQEIEQWAPFALPHDAARPSQPLISRLKSAGQWNGRQLAGRRWPIGCVALEITQRCNLDCSLCYLSTHSESVRDIPLPELFRRIDMIFRHYGPGMGVQVTGGEPTLRNREELMAIVERIHDAGMRPSLVTNGIRASRELLAGLAGKGLRDVILHVDMTQRRRGYGSEAELNGLRETYLERARGLSLRVMFMTTVFDGNFPQIPRLVRFFRRHAGRISLVSFQLQADTGRGELGRRAPAITPDSVAAQISRGAGTVVNFDAAQVGHRDCNRYAVCVEAGGRLFNLFEDSPAMGRIFDRTQNCALDSRRPFRAAWYLCASLVSAPACWVDVAGVVGRALMRIGAGLLKSRGMARKLSFFIHNFMDAQALEAERCRNCVFMVATQDGPLSMCVHNAKRDAYILRPVPLDRGRGREWWQPLTGETLRQASPSEPRPRLAHANSGFSGQTFDNSPSAPRPMGVTAAKR